MKNLSNTPSAAPKPFSNGRVMIYLAAHIFVGLIVSLVPSSIKNLSADFFIAVDSVFPAFRTWFLMSNDPIGGKIMLLLWWLVFIPLGLICAGVFTDGFSVSYLTPSLTKFKRSLSLLTTLFFVILLSYGHSFMDQTVSMASASQKHGRISLVPLAIRHGPEYFSIYLAAMSLLYVLCCFGTIVLIKSFLSPTGKKGTP